MNFQGLPEFLFPSGFCPKLIRCLVVPLTHYMQGPLAFVYKFINLRCQKLCCLKMVYLSQK